ncbi:MAG TPA: hypothetical protein VHQ95_21345, partial [Pyrinomonadaceae bacterium]|nr:hypothetical protein [Pyrinomonadaceae bacterium]
TAFRELVKVAQPLGESVFYRSKAFREIRAIGAYRHCRARLAREHIRYGRVPARCSVSRPEACVARWQSKMCLLGDVVATNLWLT